MIGFLLICALWLSCSSKTINKKPLSEGEQLFRAKCRSCHILPDPKKYDDHEWVKIMDKYGELARLKENQELSILLFLQRSN